MLSNISYQHKPTLNRLINESDNEEEIQIGCYDEATSLTKSFNGDIFDNDFYASFGIPNAISYSHYTPT